jgi:hypothetical protein
MDCDNFRILLLFYRPGRTSDLAAEDVTALEAHLSGCPTCSAHIRRDTALDAVIGKSLRGVTVPAGLKSGLSASAAATSSRLWRAKWLGRVTAASLVTIGVGVGWGGYDRYTRPALDPYTVADSQEAIVLDPERAVRDWLRVQGVSVPNDFNLRLTTGYGYDEVQGVRVPVIDLRIDGQTARLYLLPPTKFGTANAAATQNSTVTVQLFRDQPAAGWTVMVAYTGASLAPFLKAPAGPV